MTSNPTIFEKAIAGSSDYEDELQRLVADGQSTQAIYEELVLDDIRRGCDVMLPIFEASGGVDGRVSLEVLPELAADTEQTVAEGLRLAHLVGRPNVMIKVPATPEGIPAMRALTAQGVSVNVTLIFSLAQYQAVSDAYLAGLADRVAAGGSLDGLASVASFFVSRVDAACDKLLLEKQRRGSSRRGRARGEADGQDRHRQRQARLRDVPADHRGRALEAAQGQGREAAAAALGVDRNEGPALPGHALRRRAHRPRHRQHGAAGDADRVHGPRQAGGGADARSRGSAPPDRGVRRAGAGPRRASARACSPTA